MRYDEKHRKNSLQKGENSKLQKYWAQIFSRCPAEHPTISTNLVIPATNHQFFRLI